MSAPRTLPKLGPVEHARLYNYAGASILVGLDDLMDIATPYSDPAGNGGAGPAE